MIKWLAVLLIFCRSADAATVTAASASVANVQTAYNSLYPQTQNDIVYVPDGSSTWTSTLRITNGVQMRAVNIGGVTITQSGSTKALVRISGTGRFTFGGFRLIEAGPNSATSGMFDINGPGDSDFPSNIVTQANSAENCIFNFWDTRTHRCRIAWSRFTHTGSNPAHIATVFGDFGSVGSNDWAFATTYGSTNGLFVEHNEITYDSLSDGVIDAFTGAKFTVRFNNFTNAYFGWHGTDSGGYRSPHSYEIYGNNFYYDNTGYYCVFNSRGGTGLVFSNLVVGHTAVGTDFLMQYFRFTESHAPWGTMTGSNPLDGNEDGTGYPGLDQQGMTGPSTYFVGGTHTVQAHSPTYVWNNDAGFLAVADAACIVNGRDYTNIALSGYVPLGVHPFADAETPAPPSGPGTGSRIRGIRLR